MPLAPGRRHDLHELTMILLVLVLIGAVMYWRVGFALPDSLLTQWVIIGIAGYILGRGWFRLCERHPYVAILIFGFFRGLLGQKVIVPARGPASKTASDCKSFQF